MQPMYFEEGFWDALVGGRPTHACDRCFVASVDVIAENKTFSGTGVFVKKRKLIRYKMRISFGSMRACVVTVQIVSRRVVKSALLRPSSGLLIT